MLIYKLFIMNCLYDKKKIKLILKKKNSRPLSTSKIESLFRVQILGETACVSLYGNTLRKDMHLSLLTPTRYG